MISLGEGVDHIMDDYLSIHPDTSLEAFEKHVKKRLRKLLKKDREINTRLLQEHREELKAEQRRKRR